MADYTFRTPSKTQAFSNRPFWRYFTEVVGVSVYKIGSTYALAQFLQDEVAESYDEFYQGGYLHTVNTATKAALIAADIGITEANFTAI